MVGIHRQGRHLNVYTKMGLTSWAKGVYNNIMNTPTNTAGPAVYTTITSGGSTITAPAGATLGQGGGGGWYVPNTVGGGPIGTLNPPLNTWTISGVTPDSDIAVLKKMIDTINERLSILMPDVDKLEKYAALKEAYNQYKMIEALIGEDNVSEK